MLILPNKGASDIVYIFADSSAYSDWALSSLKFFYPPRFFASIDGTVTLSLFVVTSPFLYFMPSFFKDLTFHFSLCTS